MDCPCCSNRKYKECCQLYHEGRPPENALVLMRSRYSAYALNLIDYILQTSQEQTNGKEIEAFVNETVFENLEILDFIDGEKIAYVTFIASLTRNGNDISFEEKSLFEKIGGKWFYVRPVLEKA